MTSLSTSYKNKFQFTCPVFSANTLMAACVRLRNLVYANQRIDKRLGCQAAMKCGKCPANAMMEIYAYGKALSHGDHHGSAEPKDGKLHATVLERVLPVIVRDDVVNKMGVPANERMLLMSASERIAEQLKTAPGERSGRASSYEAATSSKPAKRRSAAPKHDADVEAAKRGDLAAAINAA